MVAKEVQNGDQAKKLLDSIIGSKVFIRQVCGHISEGKLIKANSEYVQLEQGTSGTKKHVYIFREGLSELSVVDRTRP